MITITPILKDELKPLVELSYSGDTIGLERYHEQPFALNEAVESTLNTIEEGEGVVEFRYFKIESDERPIGYMVTTRDILYSFAIEIKSRTKEILLPWWDEVKKLMGVFAVPLYDNNTRAINFLKKRGMVEVSREDNIVTLINE